MSEQNVNSVASKALAQRVGEKLSDDPDRRHLAEDGHRKVSSFVCLLRIICHRR
jgi:hypothetical protein